MHVKLARITVAVAARTFSTDETGENIIVKKEHVHSAREIVYRCYDNPSFGLHRAAVRAKSDSRRAESKLGEIREWFLTGEVRKGNAPQYGKDVYNGLRHVQGRFNQREFMTITGLDLGASSLCFTYLRDNSLVTYDARVGEVRVSRELLELMHEMELDDE